MYCPRCGTLNDARAQRCTSCGEWLLASAQGAAGPVRLNNYLPHAIVVTLCCCWPLGIPAIVYAAQVNSKAAAGDVSGAMEASAKARLFCWLAFGLGIVAGLLYLLASLTSVLVNLQ